MNGVRKQNDIGIRAWINPQRGSGKAGVAKATDRKDQASRRGVERVDIPTKAAQILSLDRRIPRGAVIGVQNRCVPLVLFVTAMLTASSTRAVSAVVKNVRATIIREKQSRIAQH